MQIVQAICRFRSGLVLVILTLLITLSPRLAGAAEGTAGAIPKCRPDELARLEANFQAMVQSQGKAPQFISEADYRLAALDYIAEAEACFQALQTATAAANPPLMIDEGGLSPYTGQVSPRYRTEGLKWGAGSPFSPSGTNRPGPGLPGGLVTYSYMPTGRFIVSPSDPQQNELVTDVRTLPGIGGCVEAEIDTAFAAWSAVANIQFQKVADSNTNGGASNSFGDIRIGAHFIDFSADIGPTLAHAFFPPFTVFPNPIAGDLHFDVDESWGCTPFSQIDIGIVALHEIGHSIGLGHETLDNSAVMYPIYNPWLTGLKPDDIKGAVAIYGAFTPGLQASVNATPFPVLVDTSPIDYKIQLKNSGDVNFTGVIITNIIPEETSFVSASHQGSETVPGSGEITWPVTTIPAHSMLERHFKVNVTASLIQGDQLVDTLSVTANETQLGATEFIVIIDPELVYLPVLRK